VVEAALHVTLSLSLSLSALQPIGPRAASFWLFAVPWGFRKLLSHVHATYAAPAGGLDVWITESGCDGPGEATAPLPAVLDDTFRTNYFKGYVAAAVEAAAAGVPIKGYFAWSLLDNFEWAGEFVFFLFFGGGGEPHPPEPTASFHSDLHPPVFSLSTPRGLCLPVWHYLRRLRDADSVPKSLGQVAGAAIQRRADREE